MIPPALQKSSDASSRYIPQPTARLWQRWWPCPPDCINYSMWFWIANWRESTIFNVNKYVGGWATTRALLFILFSFATPKNWNARTFHFPVRTWLPARGHGVGEGTVILCALGGVFATCLNFYTSHWWLPHNPLARAWRTGGLYRVSRGSGTHGWRAGIGVQYGLWFGWTLSCTYFVFEIKDREAPWLLSSPCCLSDLSSFRELFQGHQDSDRHQISLAIISMFA